MRNQRPIAPEEPRTSAREGSRLRRQLLLLAAILLISAPAAGAALQARAADELQQVPQLIQSGKLGEAKSLLSEYLKTNPGHSGALNLLGVVEAQEGNYSEAEATFRKAIAADPRFTGPYLNLGRLYQENASKDPQARKKGAATYERLLQFEPGNSEAIYQGALLRMLLGDYAASLAHLSHLPRELQERAQALAVRCADYAGLQNETQAQATEKQLLASPDLVEADVTSILPVLASHQETSLALKLLQGLEARQLASFDSLHSLGLLYRSAGQLAAARQALEAAAQLRPNSVPVLLDLARVADDQKDYTGALGYLAHARELEPNNGSIHFFWGIVCLEQDLAEEAYESLKKAVALNPHNAYYNYALGVVTMQRKEANESIPYLKEYCELKPHDPRGRLALGVAYYNSLDDESAEKVLSTVANDPQTAAGANFYLGRIDNRQGKYPEALRRLKLALQARPDYADAYAELGLIHLKQKEYAPAEEALERALRLMPDGYAANLNLMILYQRTKNPKAEEQAKRFEQLKEERAQRAMEFMRTIEVRP
jgi:tetratricopeptide (TPR) repeat protein